MALLSIISAGQLHITHLLYDNKGTYFAAMQRSDDKACGGEENPLHTCATGDTVRFWSQYAKCVCVFCFVFFLKKISTRSLFCNHVKCPFKYMCDRMQLAERLSRKGFDTSWGIEMHYFRNTFAEQY